ncbi:unnamed protein product [Brassicogethes aeneus]|uniref:28S ribosomal protein S22, mitochondrial n=1 Tax=Brassicogethes aeneus TaxID=1431903 RepID=A0A9P0B5J7_BRAAE|nr:unnamed protein product [Brassicogethes aeneus]
MTLLRHISQKLLINNIKTDTRYKINNTCVACVRLLNYTPKEYDTKTDPAPLFFNKEVQSLLKSLTRVEVAKVFKKRKLGEKRLGDPEFKFMTQEQLDVKLKKAQQKAEELLQIPPVLAVHAQKNKVYSQDPALQGLESSRFVFTDITFGVKDLDRLIVVRELDGTLKDAEWELRNRVNHVYFPRSGRSLKPPRVFEDGYLEDLLNRREYEFVLDLACSQFEPNEKDYQRVTSIVFQHLSDNDGFDLLRSTRHFGGLVFFLVWNKSIDNLLLDLIESSHVDEANKLMELYGKIHKLNYEFDGKLKAVRQFIEKDSTKRGALELAVQAYEELQKQKEQLESGIKAAHGIL